MQAWAGQFEIDAEGISLLVLAEAGSALSICQTVPIFYRCVRLGSQVPGT